MTIFHSPGLPSPKSRFVHPAGTPPTGAREKSKDSSAAGATQAQAIPTNKAIHRNMPRL